VRINSILKRLQSAIADPLEELNKWERIVRYIWKVLRQGAHQLSQDRASMMAASLTYRTLFGLLPVIVVGAGVAKSIMGVNRFQEFLHGSISALGLNKVQLQISDNGTSETLGSWLSDLVSSGMSINISALTWISLLVLIYSAIALLVDIETCFNIICRAKKGRTWLRRLPLYWFVLTFGPVLIAIAFWTDAQVDAFFLAYIEWDWLHWIIASLWDFAFVCFALFLLYRMVPTNRAALRPTIAGAVIATVLLLAGKETLDLYFTHAMSLRQLYGSIGLVPVFMFWLYVMWLIILLGLQVTAILQQVRVSTENEPSDK
jgi:membrane protein